MKNTIKFILLAVVSMSLCLTSCKKDEEDKDTEIFADNALAERSYDDVKDISDQAYSGTMESYKGGDVIDGSLILPCATVSIDTLATPATITIDFGPVNCLCNDGRNRRGKILVSFTGKYRNPGTVITTTFDNYFVNDHKIEGTKTVTNNSMNPSGNMTFSIQVSGTVTKPNSGGVITWNSTRTREWIAGSTTPTWLDDEYLITGSANGTSAKGTPYTITILTALHKKIGCKHFVAGVLEMDIQNRPKRTLDYGSGACDNDATVTINGVTYNIKLK